MIEIIIKLLEGEITIYEEVEIKVNNTLFAIK